MNHSILILNLIVTGSLFAIWKREGWFNLFICMVLFGTIVANFYGLVKT